MSDPIARRLAEVRARLDAACERAGRDRGEVTLLAVGKTHPPQALQTVVDAGVVDLGENRVHELRDKRAVVRGARWHLIGQLQRRKARDVVGADVLIHSVDRPRLAATLARVAEEEGVRQRVLIQVNVASDPAKGGCHLDDAADLVAYARDLPQLTVEGLMTIPPLPADGEDPAEAARPHFATLRGLRDELRERFEEVQHLSMGMSADLDAAVAEGATLVRIGTAIFGARGDGPWRPETAGPEETT